MSRPMGGRVAQHDGHGQHACQAKGASFWVLDDVDDEAEVDQRGGLAHPSGA
jgi:hypothetical protein